MAITLTEAAVTRIAKLKERREHDDFLRVGIRGGGCSGLSYFIDFVEQPDTKDKVFEFDRGVKVCVDRKSYLFLNGTEIDFQQTLVKTAFEFNNPLSKGSCSCGESFSI